MYRLLALIPLMIMTTTALADVPNAQRHEVQHLLAFVAQSDCTLIRNGSRHDAAEAVEHIRKKYDYFRDEIHSTEDFIAYSATKSTLSGLPYLVECPGGKTINSSKWLLEELMRYRRQLP
jgi:hypothetical protein